MKGNSIINRIGDRSCRCGTTTWILNAAVTNPNVIIVCNSFGYASNLEDQFIKRIQNMSWLKRWFWKRTHKVWPVFISAESFVRDSAGLRRPVILDNSVYYMD